ncbi:MAG TPA: DUF4832 domain-containing protein [Clostridia bacterium]|nr:MAG: hypothetical protein BWX97_01612 [Firmicutes bacterium ADurb.Bin146]HOD92757.1 DUF4832 domain-containing protein [Clostridia bacterium]HQM40092.1 DUF4832 domain-containing protein [Clostridia bacterium]
MKYDFPNKVDFTPLENNATQVCLFKPLKDIPGYISLHQLEDDKRIIKNPHKGWYWHYIDNSFKRGQYRDLHSSSDHLLDFPVLNHLYLRFDWGDIEIEDGIYDWSYIDSIMNQWGRYGYKFALRICTYEGNPLIPYATPKFVYEKGAKCYSMPNGNLEPDYNDPVFLFYLERFLVVAGEKFNNDPRIETVDVGSFGTWGEGHTAAGTNIQYTADVIIKHMELHAKYFSDTFVMINDDMINSCWERGAEENLRIIKRAVDLKMGIDDDSVQVSCYSRDCGYTSLRSPWLFDYFNKHAPVTLELEHYVLVHEDNLKSGFPFVEAMRKAKATFAGFHGYPRPWIERNLYMSEYAANRLGYWYFINGIALNDNIITLGRDNIIKLYIENRGFAPAYHKYTLKLALIKDNKSYIYPIETDNRQWLDNTETEVELTVTPIDIPKGDYELGIGLFENETFIEFGLKKEAYDKNGFAHICDVKVV